MSFIKGPTSFITYDVTGEFQEENLFNVIDDRIKKFAFQDIDDTYDEYSVGWVSPLNMFDSTFAYASNDYGIYKVFGLRIDERKVPSAILKKYIAKEQAWVMRDKQVPKLSRAMKAEIKERVRTELVRKAKPTPTVATVAWCPVAKQLLLFSTNSSVQAVLEGLFVQTFGVRLEPLDPDQIMLEAINAAVAPVYTATTSVIGCEFLTWLWFRADTGESKWKFQDQLVGEVEVGVGDKIALSSENPGELVTCAFSEAEARKALALGKSPEQLELIIEQDGNRHLLSLRASSFYFKGVKVPKTAAAAEANDEGGFVFERVSLFFQVLDSMLLLFDEFIAGRIDSSWAEGDGYHMEQWAAGVVPEDEE